MPADAAQRMFTLPEAQARLPLVRSIARDVVKLSQQISETRTRLEELKKRRGDSSASDVYGEELVAIEASLEEDSQRLDGYVEELFDLGIEPLDLSEGVVCFAASMFGRSVCLSWKFDEPIIAYWHESDEDWRRRQPINSCLKSNKDLGTVNRIESQFDESV